MTLEKVSAVTHEIALGHRNRVIDPIIENSPTETPFLAQFGSRDLLPNSAFHYNAILIFSSKCAHEDRKTTGFLSLPTSAPWLGPPVSGEFSFKKVSPCLSC